MPGFEIYLDEYEERDRKQRRRTKIAGAAAIIAMLMAMRRPEPKETVIVKTERVAVPVFVSRPQAVTRTVTQKVTVGEPRYYKPLPASWPDGPLPPSGLTRHLCVTPKRLLAVVGSTDDRVTVSNVGDTPLRITAIGTPERRGFVIDDSDCANKQLEAGGRCTIVVIAREARDQPMRLRIDDDRGHSDSAEITASPASRGPAS